MVGVLAFLCAKYPGGNNIYSQFCTFGEDLMYQLIFTAPLHTLARKYAFLELHLVLT